MRTNAISVTAGLTFLCCGAIAAEPTTNTERFQLAAAEVRKAVIKDFKAISTVSTAFCNAFALGEVSGHMMHFGNKSVDEMRAHYTDRYRTIERDSIKRAFTLEEYLIVIEQGQMSFVERLAIDPEFMNAMDSPVLYQIYAQKSCQQSLNAYGE